MRTELFGELDERGDGEVREELRGVLEKCGHSEIERL
jgi:hypothetical protein